MVSRRALLSGAGYAVIGASATANLLSVARAQEAAQPATQAASVCLSMVFMAGPRAKFDGNKYRKNHLPLLRRLYGDSVERIELRTAAGSFQGVPSPVLAAASLWVSDLRGFSQKLQAHSQEINADLESVSKGNVVAQAERVTSVTGEGRDTVADGSHVFSFYYPATPGAGFDSTYYVEQYVPKLYSLYGSAALRRIEVSQATADLGNPNPVIVAATHLYIRDRSAYDQAAQRAFQELTRDSAKFTTIVPYWAQMRVTAVG